jgi:hypothetical protein
MTEPMLAPSIRQPWAWRSSGAGKDVENRSETMARRAERLIGQTVLIHAGKTVDPDGYDILEVFGLEPPGAPPRGGIVGSARIEAVMRGHPSRWADPGHWQIVLTDARPGRSAPAGDSWGFSVSKAEEDWAQVPLSTRRLSGAPFNLAATASRSCDAPRSSLSDP